MEKPVVSVLFITYNHVNYVSKALDSMLIQKTDFPFRIVAGDDCSKDGTREILIGYADKFPDKIVLSNPTENIGAGKNFDQLLVNCIDSGARYIAYLEGDDYWLDENRLQKQFDILEAEADVGLVYGKYKILDGKDEFLQYKIPEYKSGFIFEDIILCKYLPSLHSSFFRTAIIKEIFAQKDYFGLDFYIVAEIAKKHKLRYVDEFFFVYRITEGSITKIHAEAVTKHFTTAMELYRKDYPELVEKGIKRGKMLLLYNQAEDNPSLNNLLQLLRNFELSVVHLKQIIKWFYLKLKKGGFK